MRGIFYKVNVLKDGQATRGMDGAAKAGQSSHLDTVGLTTVLVQSSYQSLIVDHQAAQLLSTLDTNLLYYHQKIKAEKKSLDSN
jgi:hypothetical protein